MRGKAKQGGSRLLRLGPGSLLGFMSALMFVPRAEAVAQRAAWAQATMHLTVQPRKAATGTRNPPPGSYPLDTIPNDAIISVPKQCAGPTRCPLFVVVVGDDPPTAHGPAEPATHWLRPVAEKYGLMLLATGLHVAENASRMDTVLRQVLQRFAIDPAKIAIVGRSASGWYASRMGIENPHVFNRIAVISSEVYTQGLEAPNPQPVRSTPDSPSRRAEVLLEVAADGATLTLPSEDARRLRHAGYPVKVVATLRGAEHQVEAYDFLGHWLEESWRIPDPAARPAPVVVADSLPRLTPQVLAQMTTFWTEFQKEPQFDDSVRMITRRTQLREIAVPLGRGNEDRVSTWMTDMTALARYPVVDAALKKADLTARQHDAYRVALLASLLVPAAGEPVDSTSVFGQNLAFRAAHQAEYVTLAKAGVIEELLKAVIEGCCPTAIYPAVLGIWRTP